MLTSTPRRLSEISMGMNLLIYLIGSSAGPVIARMYLQTNQVFVTSRGILTSFPSPESYNLTFLTAAIIAAMFIVFAIFLNRNIQSVAEIPRK
ncbi:MAG TPA: hypothetical protein VFY68_11180 [Nitrososphaeraceae archaeon]|nr:hypothetical protein [Nitrososphaeraceae archaeon]